MEKYTKENRYRFRLEMTDERTLEGGAETRQLCFDHIRHCLLDKRVKTGWYLGRNGAIAPQQVTR